MGKSTLFNALIGDQLAAAENYPFCTIEPNSGLVSVPDKRLHKLGVVNESVKVVPTIMEFVDIAGYDHSPHAFVVILICTIQFDSSYCISIALFYTNITMFVY